jgi:acyl-CoA synthetase (AMP-forming)/AMP-acid ligase II
MKLIAMMQRPGVDSDERVRLVDGDRSYTRGQALAAVARRVEQLRRHGVGRGHRVLALIDHDAQGLFFMAAASALGLRMLMPYNLQVAASAEWRNIAASAQPDFVVSLKRDTAGVHELGEVCSRLVVLPHGGEGPTGRVVDPHRIDHPALVENFLVLFTSGTTGSPKAISISEELICRRVASVSGKLKFAGDARVFMSGLLNNTTGVIFSFGAFLHDAALIYPSGRDVTTWPAQVADHRATHIMLRPASMKLFVESASATPVDLSSLRVVAYGAAAMPRAVLEAGRRVMPCDWIQGYGLSETYGPFCWVDEAAHQEQRYRRHAYCVGRPDDTLEIRLEPVEGHPPEIGEVHVRGRAVMEGYYDVHTGRTEAPGEWLPTGDLGQWSPDGHLLLKGRIAGSVLSENGHRIYPEEIEAVLAELPEVDEVVLVGMAERDVMEERPVACIAGPLGGYEPATIRRIVTDALERVLSREKWPDLIYAATSPFPKSPNDKVMQAEVMKQIDRDALIKL